MSQDVLINFDDLPVGTVVTNRYCDKGVDLLTPPNGDPIIAQVPPGEAHLGNQVANISTCPGCEFYTPFANGRFTFWASSQTRPLRGKYLLRLDHFSFRLSARKNGELNA